jgi:sortase A
LGAVFRELDQLKKGDPITVWMGAHLFTYLVEQVIVLPDRGISDEQRAANTRWIGPFEEERLTLVSCWPRNNNTHRIVVIARPQLTAQATQ